MTPLTKKLNAVFISQDITGVGEDHSLARILANDLALMYWRGMCLPLYILATIFYPASFEPYFGGDD